MFEFRGVHRRERRRPCSLDMARAAAEELQTGQEHVDRKGQQQQQQREGQARHHKSGKGVLPIFEGSE